MKSISQLLEEHKAAKNLIRLKGHTTEAGEEHIHITGTPEGFKLLSDILLAQAAGLGGVGAGSSCFSTIKKSHGHLPFTTDDSSELLDLHCHDNYFDDGCSESPD